MADFGALNWSILGGLHRNQSLYRISAWEKADSAGDFFLGDCSTPWWAIGISVLGT